MRSKRNLLPILVFLAVGLIFAYARTGEPGTGTKTAAPKVAKAVKNDQSRPLRDLRPMEPKAVEPGKVREIPLHRHPRDKAALSVQPLLSAPDSVLQQVPGQGDMPEATVNFEGVNNVDAVLPPDTTGDVGPNHYIQWVNLSFAVYDKSGTKLYGPAAGNTLWTGFGGACETGNDGDPIVLYDPLADRWLMSQFALPNYPNGPFSECIAVSKTGDPLGEWYRYEFQFTKMNDYPKLGVWPDGYYMSVNQFAAGTTAWAGVGVAVFERSQMLAGGAADMVFFDLYDANSNFFGLLPSDLDGPAPPVGSPNYFISVDDAGWLGSTDAMRIWEFHVDWSDPAQSTFGLNKQPNSTLDVAEWTPLCESTRSCIPQPGTGVGLDAIGDRLMYRLQYRNFGTYESLVVNHTVDAGGGRAGVRWYEVRDPGGTPVIHQQGTYAPEDGVHRWMGSIAQDGSGNLALGYSVSSGSVYPSIRYTGRLSTADPGTMDQAEEELVTGAGSQTHSSSRWGDYSTMSVDPTDDCTFWYTQEYYATTGSAGWQTRIGSFKFPNCTSEASGVLNGSVTDVESGNAVGGAKVAAGATSTTANASGAYSMSLPAGTYEVTASAFGYASSTVGSVPVVENTATTQNFSLSPLAKTTVCGTVRDGSGHGWGLYARLNISSQGYDMAPVYTDPISGEYCVELFQGLAYLFSVTALGGGYHTAVITGTPGLTQDFDLSVDEGSCSALGYGYGPYDERFEVDDGGYATSMLITMTLGLKARDVPLDAPGPGLAAGSEKTGTGSLWNWGIPLSGPGAAHSGTKVWGTNLTGNYPGSASEALYSPNLNLSSLAGESAFELSWWQWLKTEANYDFAWVDVSKDGGSTWQTVYGPVSGDVSLSWTRKTVLLDSTYAVSNFRVRFWLSSDDSNAYPGFYLDDVAVGSCRKQSGVLVSGNVFDANTLNGLNGATVSSGGWSTVTSSTPTDDGTADGYYSLFLHYTTSITQTLSRTLGVTSTGTLDMTASAPGGYAPEVRVISAEPDQAVRQDFDLDAGYLAASPDAVEVTLNWGESLTRTVSLSNTGGAPATFQTFEVGKVLGPVGPFEKPSSVVKPFKQQYVSAQPLKPGAPPPAPPYAAGDVLQSWQPGITAWGIAFDAMRNTVWISSPGASWGGSNTLYEYSVDGTPTGVSWPYSWNPPNGPADMAFHWNTGRLWLMNVDSESSGNCIYEVDPTSGYTGKRICPGGAGFVNSQRGLAYDPVTDSYFAGSWNDSMIHHFASDGTMLDEIVVGLPVAGLAYNPTTRHLFVMTNSDPNPVYVLDAANGYGVLGSFLITGFSAYGGAGLEFDCDGNLWAADQATGTVYRVQTGETTTLCQYGVPWLSTSPITGTISAGGQQSMEVTLDSGVPEITGGGTYQAILKIVGNTPYPPREVRVTMNVVAEGSLQGTITPDGAVDAGAMWKLSGGEWKETGDIIPDLDVGKTYTVVFKEIPGWIKPANKTVTLEAGRTKVVSGKYVKLPTVNITVRDSSASEPAGAGSFKITRSGNTATSLVVDLKITGTAVNGVDYKKIPAGVKIPAGSSSVLVKVVPVNDSKKEDNETVVLTLVSSPRYVKGTNRSAKIVLRDDD